MEELSSSGNVVSGKALRRVIVHRVFTVALFLKGFNGCVEILIAILFFFFKRESISYAVTLFLEHGTAGISNHFPVNYLAGHVDNVSGAKYFIAYYFLFYGVVNIFLVIFLLKGKLWAYPVAMIATSFFIGYLLYRFFLYHSGLLLFFTLIDVVMVILTWLEYQRVKEEIVKNP